jgi:predicted O-methyltransferase YrrM
MKRRRPARSGPPSASDTQPNPPEWVGSAQNRWPQLEWTGNDTLRVGATEFYLSTDSTTYSAVSTTNRLTLLKTKKQLDFFARHAPSTVHNIVDLGIYKGGSIALYHELFRPKRIVGLDLISERAPALDEFISRNSLDDTIRLYYNTDQSDRNALESIMRENFGEEPIDLVVDDASHLYEPTKRSLNELLPRLRPGGVYVIEDWGWAHWPDEYYQGSTHPFTGEVTPLSKLILELVMVNASRPGLVNEIHIRPANVYLVRGREPNSPGIDIASSYSSSGYNLLKP